MPDWRYHMPGRTRGDHSHRKLSFGSLPSFYPFTVCVCYCHFTPRYALLAGHMRGGENFAERIGRCRVARSDPDMHTTSVKKLRVGEVAYVDFRNRHRKQRREVAQREAGHVYPPALARPQRPQLLDRFWTHGPAPYLRLRQAHIPRRQMYDHPAFNLFSNQQVHITCIESG